MTLIEPIIGVLRPAQLAGKGLLFDWATPHEGTRTVTVWGQHKMTLDLANAVHRQIFMGCFGRYMTRCTRALLPRGGTFVDVGSHAGYFTLLASHLAGAGGRVFAIEPNPAAWQALQDHLRMNGIGNVQAPMIALSDANGSLRLYVPPASEHRDYNVTFAPIPGFQPVDVPCRRLDDCLADWRLTRVDVMKIDVEGAEPLVIAGGAGRLKKGVVRHLIVEVNGPRLTDGGSSPAKLVDQLAALGFVPAVLAGGRARPVSGRGFDLDPAHEHDRLFVHTSVN
jgi:FkbM family methyltransferase